MNTDYYRNFIAIVESGSLSAAAKRISIAQSALSTQMKILQAKMGTPLLEIRRGGHSLSLTQAGQLFLNTARTICDAEDRAIKEMEGMASGFYGTLRLSLSPSMSIPFIRQYMRGFVQQYPHINFELYEVPIQLQTEQLLDGKTEIGFASAPLQQIDRFETIYQRREGLKALFHKDSPFLKDHSPSIMLYDLQEMPLCISRGCSSLLLNTCRDSHILPNILSINTTKMSAAAWAMENLGIAVVPAGRFEVFPDVLVDKSIMDSRLYLDQTLSVVKGRPLSTVAKLFINYFRKNEVPLESSISR